LQLVSVARVLFYADARVQTLQGDYCTPRSSDVRQTEKWRIMAIIFVASSVMALSTGSSNFKLDLAWMFAFWLDGLALLPQVLHVRRSMYVDETQLHFASGALLSGLVSAIFFCRQAMDGDFYGNFSTASSPFFLGLFLVSLIRVAMCLTYLGVFVRSSKSYTDLFAPSRQTGISSQGEFFGWLPGRSRVGSVVTDAFANLCRIMGLGRLSLKKTLSHLLNHCQSEARLVSNSELAWPCHDQV